MQNLCPTFKDKRWQEMAGDAHKVSLFFHQSWGEKGNFKHHIYLLVFLRRLPGGEVRRFFAQHVETLS